jgi:hypothetical protein
VVDEPDALVAEPAFARSPLDASTFAPPAQTASTFAPPAQTASVDESVDESVDTSVDRSADRPDPHVAAMLLRLERFLGAIQHARHT